MGELFCDKWGKKNTQDSWTYVLSLLEYLELQNIFKALQRVGTSQDQVINGILVKVWKILNGRFRSPQVYS